MTGIDAPERGISQQAKLKAQMEGSKNTIAQAADLEEIASKYENLVRRIDQSVRNSHSLAKIFQTPGLVGGQYQITAADAVLIGQNLTALRSLKHDIEHYRKAIPLQALAFTKVVVKSNETTEEGLLEALEVYLRETESLEEYLDPIAIINQRLGHTVIDTVGDLTLAMNNHLLGLKTFAQKTEITLMMKLMPLIESQIKDLWAWHQALNDPLFSAKWNQVPNRHIYEAALLFNENLLLPAQSEVDSFLHFRANDSMNDAIIKVIALRSKRK